MAQASPTTCAHNAPGQVRVGGRSIQCIQCGAQIQPSPRAVDAGGRLVGADNTNAAYPADANTNDRTWVFSQ